MFHFALLSTFLLLHAIEASLANAFLSLVSSNVNSSKLTGYGVQTLPNPYPYAFPNQFAANTSDLFPMPQCHGVIIEEATIDQLQDY